MSLLNFAGYIQKAVRSNILLVGKLRCSKSMCVCVGGGGGGGAQMAQDKPQNSLTQVFASGEMNILNEYSICSLKSIQTNLFAE